MRRRRRHARAPGTAQRLAVWGGALGLVLAFAVVALALSGRMTTGPVAEAVAAVVAIPPFALKPLRGLATGGVVLVTLIWWPVLGAMLGGLIGIGVGRARWGWTAAACLVAAAALGHVAAYVAVQRDVGAAADALGAVLRAGSH